MTLTEPPRPGFEERLLAELKSHVAARAERRRETTTRYVHPRRLLRPAPGWRLAAALGLVLVLTAGAFLVETVRIGGRTPAATASAAEILAGAAAAAERQPELVARPDQFLFVESRVHSGDALPTGVARDQRIQRWVAVGDSSRSLQRRRPEDRPDAWTDDRVDVPVLGRYVTDLPTDRERMLRYLRERPFDMQLPPGADVPALMQDPDKPFISATELLDGYVPPRSLAALFQAMATVPGVRVVPEPVTDAAGRRGVALRTPGTPGSKIDLIFDPETYAYLGTRNTVTRDGEETLLYVTARLRMAIVDRAGQLP